MTGTGLLLTGLLQVEPSEPVEVFHPLLPGLILLLPLFGFLTNGVLALIGGTRGAVIIRGGRGSDDADGHEGASRDASNLAARPLTHALPTWIGPGVVGGAFLLTGLNFLGMLEAGPHEPVVRSYWTWMATGTLGVDAAIQLDQLSLIMMMVITGVGFLIHVFSVGYMKDDPGYPRYFCYLNLFIFFMLVLVMGSSFPLMFVGWEGVGLCSYLLIGFWFEDPEKADAGKKAFIVNRIGDFGFLLAIFLLFTRLGAVDYVGVFAVAPDVLSYGGSGRDVGGIAPLARCDREERASSALRLAPRRDGRPDTGFRPHPRGYDGHGRSLSDRSYRCPVRPGTNRVGRGGDRRCGNGALLCDHRTSTIRHQEGPGVLHGVPAGLHVLGGRGRSLCRWGLPPHDPRVFQGASLPGRRCSDPLDASLASLDRQ